MHCISTKYIYIYIHIYIYTYIYIYHISVCVWVYVCGLRKCYWCTLWIRNAYQSISIYINLYQSISICINLYQSISISLSLSPSHTLFISIYINSCLISIQSVSLVDWTPTPLSPAVSPESSGNFSHLLIPAKVSANGVGLISHPGIGALAIGKLAMENLWGFKEDW